MAIRPRGRARNLAGNNFSRLTPSKLNAFAGRSADRPALGLAYWWPYPPPRLGRNLLLRARLTSAFACNDLGHASLDWLIS